MSKKPDEFEMVKRPDRPIYPDERVNWSGVARSMQCALQQGTFNNFKLITLTIDNGIVVDRKESEPYASFEAIARMEIEMQSASLHINHDYRDGKTWST